MRLNINNYSLICNQGTAKFNEDVVGITPFGAWVLDGATGLNGKNLVSNDSDARWYVQWWNNYLYSNISKDESLKDIMIKGIEHINKEYQLRLNGTEIEKLDKPSSSIAIIKFYEDKIEYLILGDCSIFIKDKDVKVIRDNTICKFDKAVFDRMNDITNLEEMSFEKIKSSVMDLIISNRLKKNTINGYWILEFDEEAIKNALHGYLNINSNTKLMMTSDGFSCIADRYGVLEEEDLINIAHEYGIQFIFDKVREFEEKDYKTIEFPRFKVKDDSSCIYLDIDIR